MAVFLLTLGGIAIVMAIMAIGVLLDGRCLRGSCGGPDVLGPDGGSLACAACPRIRAADLQKTGAKKAASGTPITGTTSARSR